MPVDPQGLFFKLAFVAALVAGSVAVAVLGITEFAYRKFSSR